MYDPCEVIWKNDSCSFRSEGVALGQVMLDSGYIENVDGTYEFSDGATLYRATPADSLPEEDTKHDSSAGNIIFSTIYLL